MVMQGLIRFFRNSRRRFPVYIDGIEGSTGPQGPAGPAGADGAAGVGVLNFTTAEQDTGRTWTDGETIYQKTVHFAAGPNNGVVNTAHNITGLDRVVAMSGTMTNGTIQRFIPNVEAVDTTQLQVAISSTNLILASGVGGDFSAYSGDVTLWYTKT